MAPMYRRIMAIAAKERLHITRDVRTLAAIFVFPVVQLILFSYALTYDIKYLPTALFDSDQSTASRNLARSFSGSTFFRFDRVVGSEAQEDEALDSGSIKVVIRIPRGFEENLLHGRNAPIQVLVDGSEPNSARLASGYAGAIAQGFQKSFLASLLERKGLRSSQNITPIDLRQRVWYNPNRTSVVYLLPGLIPIIMMSVSVIHTALAIVREKDSGTIEQIMVSPVRGWELIVGKILPYLVLASLDAVFITVVGLVWFGVPLRGSVGLLVLSAALFVLGSIGIGIFISAVSDSMQVASQFAYFVALLPGFLLSGFVFPIASMPVVLQWVSGLVPARYLVVILRGVFLKGTGFRVLWPQLAALVVYDVVAVAMAATALRRRRD